MKKKHFMYMGYEIVKWKLTIVFSPSICLCSCVFFFWCATHTHSHTLTVDSKIYQSISIYMYTLNGGTLLIYTMSCTIEQTIGKHKHQSHSHKCWTYKMMTKVVQYSFHLTRHPSCMSFLFLPLNVFLNETGWCARFHCKWIF